MHTLAAAQLTQRVLSEWALLTCKKILRFAEKNPRLSFYLSFLIQSFVALSVYSVPFPQNILCKI